jgi:hypothetical protein
MDDPLTEARKYALKRTYYGLDNILVFERLKPKTLEEWEALAQKYPEGKAGFSAIDKLRDDADKVFKRLSSTRFSPLPGNEDFDPESFVPNKAVKVGSKESIYSSSGHASTVIKTPSGYHFWDPHGKPVTDEKSSMTNLRGPLSRLPGKLTQCNMLYEFQTYRGTCQFWSILRQIHPEKTDEEFKQMVLDVQERTGLPQNLNYIERVNKTVDSNLDLIPIALFEQVIAEGINEFATPAEKLESRKGLGRKKCKRCGLLK